MFAYCGNNPINNRDNAGTNFAGAISPEVVPCALTILALLDTATPVLEITLLILAIVSLDETRELVKTFAKTKTSNTKKRTHHVYILQDPQQENIIKYVGRTNDPDRRMREHKRDPLHPERKNYNMVVLASGLTKEQAMALEQILISAFTLGNLENARR